jgi:hypothetical protein
MSARNTTPSLIGIATLWCTPAPNCAGLGVQDGVNGDGLVLRASLVLALRRDRTVAIPHLLRTLLPAPTVRIRRSLLGTGVAYK